MDWRKQRQRFGSVRILGVGLFCVGVFIAGGGDASGQISDKPGTECQPGDSCTAPKDAESCSECCDGNSACKNCCNAFTGRKKAQCDATCDADNPSCSGEYDCITS